MLPATYNLPDAYRGDTYHMGGIAFVDDETGLGMDITGCTMRMQFRRNNYLGKVEKELTTSAGIVIVSAASGLVQVTPFVMDVKPGYLVYDLEVTHEDETITTYISGTLRVHADKTY